MDRMKLQELALLRMYRYGEVEVETRGKQTILHSKRDKDNKTPTTLRDRVPQMELRQGFD